MDNFILTVDESFVEMALAEVDDLAPTATIATLAPGVLLVSGALPFTQVAIRWQQEPPIFIRHICPVQATIPLRNKPEDIHIIRQSLPPELVAQLDPSQSFSVQTRLLAELPYKPFDINNLLAETLQTATNAPLDVRAPQQILSVVCAVTPGERTVLTRGGRAPTHTAYIGLSLAHENLSNWAGGMRRYAREADQLSRSEFKLLEALEIFGITLPSRGVALDLGAAPGGWTRVLRQREQYVTAVDPAELDSRLLADRGVRHKRISAENYLLGEPDHFDLIVNDMRMDATVSAQLMVRYAPYLYPHGFALVTLKLAENQRGETLAEAFTILDQAYTIAGAKQLFHNRSEITVWLKPI